MKISRERADAADLAAWRFLRLHVRDDEGRRSMFFVHDARALRVGAMFGVEVLLFQDPDGALNILQRDLIERYDEIRESKKYGTYHVIETVEGCPVAGKAKEAV